MKITHHKNGKIKTLVDEAPYHPGYEDAGFKPKEMNANELAKGLSQNQIYGDDYGLFNKRIQNMLRQQADRIAELEKQLEDAKDKTAEWQMSYENCHRMCSGYGMN